MFRNYSGIIFSHIKNKNVFERGPDMSETTNKENNEGQMWFDKNGIIHYENGEICQDGNKSVWEEAIKNIRKLYTNKPTTS